MSPLKGTVQVNWVVRVVKKMAAAGSVNAVASNVAGGNPRHGTSGLEGRDLEDCALLKLSPHI